MNRRIVISILICLSGCATERANFVAEPTPPPGEALVYVYRPSATAMEGLTAVVELDATMVAVLHDNGYAVVHVREGEHRVSQYWRSTAVTDRNRNQRNRTDLQIHAVAGQQYYFRVLASGVVGPQAEVQFSQSSWVFEQVSTRTADSEIAKCKRESSK